MNCLLPLRVVGQVFALLATLITGAIASEPAATDASGRIEPPPVANQKSPANQKHDVRFTVRAIDQYRKGVASAVVGSWGVRNADSNDGWQFIAETVGEEERTATTDANGEAILFVDRLQSRTRELALVARNETRKLVGIKPVSRDELRAASETSSTIEITLEPECRVIGRVESTSLAALKRPLGQIGVGVDIDDRAAFTFISSKPNYEFFLPSGTYTLSVDEDNAIAGAMQFTVPRGATEMRLDTVDLSATNMVRLVGRAAPELADVVAWKNTGPLKLADLHGKYVLLDFWGYWCGTCINEMPKLFDLQARYRQRLVIIGVHVGLDDDGIDTVEKLNAELAEDRKTIWGGRDLPFPVAMLATRKTTHRESDRSARTRSSADYGVQGYPSQVLIDPRGNVVGRFDPKEHVKLFD